MMKTAEMRDCVRLRGRRVPSCLVAMSTHKLRQKDGAVYFATFSCHEWVPLFSELQAYEIVYNWMRDLSRWMLPQSSAIHYWR